MWQMEETLRSAQCIVSAFQEAATKRRDQLHQADEALDASPHKQAALVVKRRLAAAQLKLILSHLQTLKADIIDKGLLVLAEAASCKGGLSQPGFVQEALEGFRKQLSAWLSQEQVQELLQEEGIDLEKTAREASNRRAAVFRRDVAAIQSFMLGLDDARASSLSKLQDVVQSLRDAEAGSQFHLRLVQDVHAATASSSYTLENFAYGSTPFCSWLTVMQHAKVQPLVQALVSQGRQYVVWGSSLGWLVFYGALSLAWSRSVGYELLPGMVETALGIRERHQADRVEFVCGDMLLADVSSAGLVMLASQCWDKTLMEKAGSKLVAELPMGSLVVDYGPALIPFLGEPLTVVEVEVSWNHCQAMHVFLQQRSPEGN